MTILCSPSLYFRPTECRSIACATLLHRRVGHRALGFEVPGPVPFAGAAQDSWKCALRVRAGWPSGAADRVERGFVETIVGRRMATSCPTLPGGSERLHRKNHERRRAGLELGQVRAG